MGAVNKDIKIKKNFTENHGHNILRPFNTCLRYIRVTKQPQTSDKDQENTKTSYNYNLLPSLPPKIKNLLILTKNC